MGAIDSVSTGLRLASALCLLLCAGTAFAAPWQVYDIDLRAQDVADGLKSLSVQTGTAVVFPYDLAKNRKGNPVVGRYTLLEALDLLLKDTGLSGGLSDKGVLTISPLKSGTPKRNDTSLTNRENQQNMNGNNAAHRASIAAFFASITAAFSASAQNESDDQTKVAQVTVTAQKKTENLQDVPVPVSVLDTARLTGTNQVRLRDYFAEVPGINVMPSYVAQQNVSIRGITTGGGSTPTVGFTIDDVPFGASSGSHGDHVPDMDPGDLQRVEVLRGPQGTLYGADSMGGLVKYVTVDPSTAGYSGRVEAGTSGVHNSSEPGFTVRASLNGPLSDELAIRISGFKRQDPGYIDNPVYHLNNVNDVQSDGARIAALWRPAENISLKVSALYQNSKANALDEVDVGPGLGDLQQNYLPGSGFTHVMVQAYSALLHAKFGSFDLTSLTGYNVNWEEDGLDWGFAFGQGVQQVYGVSGTLLREHDNVSKLTQEVRVSTPIGDHLEWLVGGFYTHENDYSRFNVLAQDTQSGQYVGNYWDFRQTKDPDKFQEYAAFTNLTFHATDQFDIQAGLRESHLQLTLGELVQTGPFVGDTPAFGPAEDSSANSFTYLVTPQFKISPDFMVYARFASGYRPGTPNLPVAGQPRESKPDKTITYEVGTKGDFLDHALSLDASIYYVDWKDIQILLTDPVSHLVYNTNGGKAKSEGAELSVTLRPTTDLNISAWVDYDNAVLTQAFPANSPTYGVAGDRLPLSSRYSGNASVQQEFQLWNDATGFAGGAVSYVGNRVGTFGSTPDRQEFPSYTKTDLRAGVKSDSWTTTLYANNVFDKRALVNGGTGYFYPAARIYIAPRTIGVNVAKTF
jgi:outer membrane receptor protein involved in Fe transport